MKKLITLFFILLPGLVFANATENAPGCEREWKVLSNEFSYVGLGLSRVVECQRISDGRLRARLFGVLNYKEGDLKGGSFQPGTIALLRSLLERQFEKHYTAEIEFVDVIGGHLGVVGYFQDWFKQRCSQRLSCGLMTIAKSVCSSACVHFYLLGDKRVSWRKTKFGFHATNYARGNMKVGTEASIVNSIDDLAQVGMPWNLVKNIQDQTNAFASLDIKVIFAEEIRVQGGWSLTTKYLEDYRK